MAEVRELLESLPGWLEAAAALDPRLGYLALALAMLLENLIPPIPSELIQPLAGFLVGQGRLELLPVILAGGCGTVLGCWFWYGLGRWIGEARLVALITRHGAWLGLDADDLAAAVRDAMLRVEDPYVRRLADAAEVAHREAGGAPSERKRHVERCEALGEVVKDMCEELYEVD